MTRCDVVVVGAGVAGLRAAVELAAMGANVLVVESRAVLGGRASSFTDPATGERVDNGQHVLLWCYDETFAFLRHIGAEERVHVQPQLDVEFVDRAGARSRLRLPALPAPMNLVAGLLDWDALGWRDRAAAMRLAQPLRIAVEERTAAAAGTAARRIAASPGETVTEWLVHNGQTQRIREMLWEPLVLAALNQSPDEAAAPPFAAVLARMFSGDARASALALPRCPLDALFAEPARRYIEARGGTFMVGCGARICVSGGRFSHVVARGERIDAAAVVAAVPWHALPELFDGDTAPLADVCRAAAATRASAIVSVNLWLGAPVLRTPFLGLPRRTFQWAFDKQQVFEGAGTHLTLVSSGADALIGTPPDALIATALDELRDALPEARAAKVLRATTVKERRATFSIAPGQPARPATRTGVHGLVLAGDWIDTGLPATLECAALSGRLAAEALS